MVEPTRIVGPPQTAAVPTRVEVPARLALGFAVNQVLNGMVMEAIGRRATIALEGRQIVAQSSAPLQAGDQVQLLVRDISAGRVLMQVLSRTMPSAVQPLLSQDFANWLASLGLQPTERNRQIIQQLMLHQLSVDRRAVEELGAALARLGAQGQADVRAGVFLRAMGLPLTRATLDLVRKHLDASFELGDALARLEKALDLLLAAADDHVGPEPAQLRDLAGRFKQLLAEQPLHGEEVPGALAGGEEGPDGAATGHRVPGEELSRRLRQLLDNWGTTPEHKLARLLQGAATETLISHDLRSQLDRLLQEATALQTQVAGDSPAGRALAQLRGQAEGLIHHLEYQQVSNAAAPPTPTENYYVVQLPWAPGEPWETVQMKVSRDAPEGAGATRPRRVHAVFDFDLKHLEHVRVDLTVVQSRLALRITSSSPAAEELIRTSAGQLEEALEELGFTVGALETGPLEAEPAAEAAEAPSAPPAHMVRIDAVV